jgi:predicted 3-demethylubiquinone-9 3-methyltransferase (glyoxalase superfamily)
MRKITPHSWFDKEAREAAEFYVSLFPNSKVTSVTSLHNTPSGDVDVVSFELFSHPFMAISAGPSFNSWQRGVPIVHGGEERVLISSPRITLYSIR